MGRGFQTLIPLAVTVFMAGVSRAGAQAVTPLPCPADQATAFDFLVGEWQGVVYDLHGPDSTASGVTAHVSTRKGLNGCALEERWYFEDKGAPEVDDIVLRAFDMAKGRWGYALATNRNEFVLYDGRQDGNAWRFYYDLTADGKTTRIRITWVPTPWGYSEQIARSADAGQTWALTRHINFIKARGRS